MKAAAYVGGVLGLGLLVWLLVRSDVSGMLHAARLGGWGLLWLTPYRVLYFIIYAAGWRALLRPYNREPRVGFGYLLWVTSVREAVDRLLPVASVGGAVVGVRLMGWRGIAAGPASATVIMEVLLTIFSLWLFSVLGLVLLIDLNAGVDTYRHLLIGILFSAPVPVTLLLILRHGSVFGRLGGLLRGLAGLSGLSQQGAALDQELRACLQRTGALAYAGVLQFVALVSGSVEVWLAMRLFGHPCGFGTAVIMESMTQAVRHGAFVVPAGLGVQEAGLVIVGHALGIGSDLSLAVSLAKRIREVLCGVPALLSWQWMEARRLRMADAA